MAVTEAVVDPSEGMEGVPATNVSAATWLVVGGTPTAMLMVLVSVPALAVTVMVRTDESPPVDNCEVTWPALSLLAVPTLSAPELALSVTVASLSTTLLASLTNAVMVAGAEPSARMVVSEEVTTSDAGTTAVTGGTPTGTATVAVSVPDLAVTVMVRTVESPPVVKVTAT